MTWGDTSQVILDSTLGLRSHGLTMSTWGMVMGLGSNHARDSSGSLPQCIDRAARMSLP